MRNVNSRLGRAVEKLDLGKKSAPGLVLKKFDTDIREEEIQWLWRGGVCHRKNERHWWQCRMQ